MLTAMALFSLSSVAQSVRKLVAKPDMLVRHWSSGVTVLHVPQMRLFRSVRLVWA